MILQRVLVPALADALDGHLKEVAADARRILDAEGINYTHGTSNGLYGQATAAGLEVQGAVGSTGRGAVYANYGRRPGRMPPDAPIRAWLRDKVGVAEGKELDRRTYLTRRKIARRGTRATRFLDRALALREPDLAPTLARAAETAMGGTSLL